MTRGQEYPEKSGGRCEKGRTNQMTVLSRRDCFRHCGFFALFAVVLVLWRYFRMRLLFNLHEISNVLGGYRELFCLSVQQFSNRSFSSTISTLFSIKNSINDFALFETIELRSSTDRISSHVFPSQPITNFQL